MREHTRKPDGGVNAICGDPAYAIDQQILCPHPDNALTPDQEEFDKQMSTVRAAVEWGFGKVTKLFSFNAFKRNLKIHLQPVGLYYAAAVLLTNCHTHLYGNQISKFFGLKPLSLDGYLV